MQNKMEPYGFVNLRGLVEDFYRNIENTKKGNYEPSLNNRVSLLTPSISHHDTSATFQKTFFLSRALISMNQFSFPYSTSNGLSISKI